MTSGSILGSEASWDNYFQRPRSFFNDEKWIIVVLYARVHPVVDLVVV